MSVITIGDSRVEHYRSEAQGAPQPYEVSLLNEEVSLWKSQKMRKFHLWN